MKKGLLIFSLAISLNFIILAPCENYAADKSTEELKLYLNEIEVILVDNPIRVVIGNPEIADIADVSKSEITVVPKAVGATTLVFWDNYGEQSYSLRVFAEDIRKIKSRVDNLLKKLQLPEVYSEASEEEARVILLGRVKSPSDRERIAVALGPLKDKTTDLIVVKEEETVVDIDVQVLELDTGARSTLGFTWPSTTGTITVTDVSAPINIAGTFADLFTIDSFTRSAFSFGWKLDLLVEEGKARILSRPHLACQSGKEAELLVGGEIPVLTTTVAATTGATGTEVEYKEYGIKLKIKPQVNEDGRIKLALNVEVSDIGSTAETIGESATNTTAKAYPLTKRSVSTEVFLDNGDTMAIGGLIKQKTEEDLQKFPWLGDVPILGMFFRQKDIKRGSGKSTKGDTELFITLTPAIIQLNAEKNKETGKAKSITEAKTATIAPKDDNPVVFKQEIKPKEETVSKIVPVPRPLAEYAAAIQKLILHNLTYPHQAKEAGFQGTVRLSLCLSYLGELLDAKVKSTSGYQILDDDALSVAINVTDYPPFPAAIEQKDLWIDIPVAYHLD